MNETRVELAVELHSAPKVKLSVIIKLSVYCHPGNLLISDHILRKRSFHILLTSIPIFSFLLFHIWFIFPIYSLLVS